MILKEISVIMKNFAYVFVTNLFWSCFFDVIGNDSATVFK